MRGKLDRRKKYTRRVLKESMIALLENKTITAITVKEVCEMADINRSTFYTHYSDHFDLLDKMEEEITEDINNYMNSYSFKLEEESVQMTQRLLEYIRNNKRIFYILLIKNGDPTFEKRLMTIARRFMMSNWMFEHHEQINNSKYLSTFVISGAIHVIKEWIENDMDRSPNDMAVMINGFINDGL